MTPLTQPSFVTVITAYTTSRQWSNIIVIIHSTSQATEDIYTADTQPLGWNYTKSAKFDEQNFYVLIMCFVGETLSLAGKLLVIHQICQHSCTVKCRR